MPNSDFAGQPAVTAHQRVVVTQVCAVSHRCYGLPALKVHVSDFRWGKMSNFPEHLWNKILRERRKVEGST